MNNIIDPADKKIFTKIGSIQEEIKESLIKLLMTEVKLEAARGNPERFRGYRKTVLTWMRDNVTDREDREDRKDRKDREPTRGKRTRDTPSNTPSRYKVEFEFERKGQKRQRTSYPEEPVKIPLEILQAAFLSGQNNRMYQTHTQDPLGGILPIERILQDSNRVSGMVPPH